MPSRNLKQEYSTNSAVSNEPREEKSPAPEGDESLADLTLDDLEGGDNDAAIIEALTAEDKPSERAKTAEALRRARWRKALEEAGFTELSKSFSDEKEPDNPVKEEAAPQFTKLSVAIDPTDNPVNQKRSVSAYRDAKTMRQLRGLFKSRDFSADDTSLVSYLQSLFASPSKRFYKRDPSIFKPWWNESWHPDLPKPARQYRKPAQWRDISDQLKVTLRHVALKTFGPTMAASLNLSSDVEAQAKSETYPLGWLHRRISHHLQEELGRPVQFHPVLEEAGIGHRLHIHMELQASFSERRKVREALRKIGGEWDAESAHRQFYTRVQPDIGWANYLVKDLWRVGFTRKVLPADFKPSGPEQTTIRFSGSPTCSTDLLDRKAAEIWGDLRGRAR
jgi:hypothetical protein